MFFLISKIGGTVLPNMTGTDSLCNFSATSIVFTENIRYFNRVQINLILHSTCIIFAKNWL